MIDKTLRKAKAERHGNLIVVRMTGGGDCLWLNMYLDMDIGQMTCDSDIGSYAYYWGANKQINWAEFWYKWLSNGEWLLHKCCGERNAEKKFDRDATIGNLRLQLMEGREENEDARWDVERVLKAAGGFDTKSAFAMALNAAAKAYDVDLPDEWWNCMVERYTPYQLRFAEICREVIVPAIRNMDRKECGSNDC